MRRLFSFLIFATLSTVAFAQENNVPGQCGNGLDDDGDGFIDCYDSDCALESVCDDIFIGNDATCTLTPPPAPAFTMSLDFSSANETTNHFSRMAIGDLNRDGIPEIITMNKYTNNLVILNGNDGTIKHDTTMVGATPEWEIAIANIDNDNCAEIFFLGTDSKIHVYDCKLRYLYSTIAMPDSDDFGTGGDDPINFGIADFDGDGKSEIYCKNQIFDAHSGRRLIATPTAATGWDNLNGGPVAVNMTGDFKLELVVGLTIYNVNIPASRATDAGSLSVFSSRADYFTRNVYNATSVADFNQDGSLDVIASGSTGCNGKNTTIFFWDVLNNRVRTYSDHNAINGDDDYETGWKNGTGRVNIADLDGDGQLNLSYVSGGFLYALKEDMTRLWRVAINEETSGYTGCTLFDFNGDGKSEIVYRDEQFLYIIDGTDGSIFNQQNCVSRTNREYPIVADVDADGSTEICVTCGFDDVAALANFNDTPYSRYSHVRVFKSAAEPWVPARRVWNQHGYFVVNVNDNLTIPIRQQLHSKEFSTTACRPGDPVGPIKPLNKFLNQSPFIDTDGCPAYLAVDLAYQTQISFTAPTCPNLDFQVQFTITNRGEVSLSGTVPVSFYDSNPLKNSNANKLATLQFAVSDLERNEPFVINESITTTGSTDSLFVVLNDAGNVIPVVLPNTSILECDYDNVRGVRIRPLPVSLVALDLTPNETCSFPPTGSARAYVPVGGTENTSDYNFYWFDGTTVGAIASADKVGPIYSNIVDGDYRVFAIHKTAACSSDTASVVIDSAPGTFPPITVTLISDQTECNPPNGSLQAAVGGPGGNAGYEFEWEDSGGPIGVTGALLADQIAGTYTVIVTHTLSGCSDSKDGEIKDFTQEPDVVPSATPVTNCQNLNSGEVTAEVFLPGNPVPQPVGDYTFEWYHYDNATSSRGSIIPEGPGDSGPIRKNLPIGFYEVVAKNNTTLCESPTPNIIEITDERDVPVITMDELAKQTKCDPLDPNGSLRALASINGGAPTATGFTFEWFVGQNTLPANAHAAVIGLNGHIAEEVRGGGQSYTVRVSTPDQCIAIADTVVTEELNVPIVTLTPTPNGICNASLAGVSGLAGEVSASVTFDGATINAPFTGYTFEWYNGSTTKLAPDYDPVTTKDEITGLDAGYYTLVVTNTLLGCKSTPETEEVDNTKILPVVLVDGDSSTTCTPLAPGLTPNGSVRVKRVDGINPSTATHSFQWHDGIDDSGPTVGNPNDILIPSLQGGAGEFYTVVVINKSNGCQTTATAEVADAQAKPIITLDPTDNQICGPGKNGSMLVQSITYKGNPFVGAHTYQWFNGVGTGSPNNSSTTATLSGLAAGDYSATVTLTATGCVSDFASEEVEDDLSLPTILTTPTASTNCSGGNANGSISAAVDIAGVPTTTGFNFQWYQGIDITTDPQVPNTPNNGNTFNTIRLQGGQNFTVEVTNPTTGCTNTATVLLDDDSEVPVITPLQFSPNLNCSAPFNGTAAVNAATPFTYRGSTITNPYAGFTLVWSGGTVNPAGDQISALAAGVYTLQVTAGTGNTITNNNDNCISNAIPVTILDILTNPTIDITETKQTSCDPSQPNGQLEAVETSGSGTYTFNWYAGAGVGAPGTELAEISDGLTTAVLIEGDYTVSVINTTTRCATTETTFLADDITLPSLLLLASSPVTHCASPNGEITATPTVTSTTDGDFTIFYLKQNTTDPFLVKAGFSSSDDVDFFRPNLGPGFFASLIRDEITHCESQVITVEVLDQTDPADITINAITNATFCNTSDGGINIDVAGIAPAFTFRWHVGGTTNMGPYDYINDENGTYTPTFNPDTPPFPVTTEDLSSVGVGLYTVEVIDSRGCGVTFSESVPFVNAPTILVSHTNSTQCDPLAGDGTITTDITGVNDYTINLYLGLNLATATLIDTDGPLVGGGIVMTAGLDPGDYLIEIIDNVIACNVYRTATIGIDARRPIITLGTITPNTACDDTAFPDGAVEITVSKHALDPRNPATTPLIFRVDNISPAPVPAPAFPVALSSGVGTVTSTLNGFGAQMYEITVREVTSGCVTSRFVTVPDKPVIPVLGTTDITVTNDSFCAPNSNGSAEVVSITPVALTDYEFTWYSNATLTTQLYQANGTGTGDGELFDVTKPGYALGLAGQGIGTKTYYVRGERLPGTGAGVGCPTPAVQVVIQDTHITPTLTLTPSPDTSCDPLIGEGSISVRTVTNSAVAMVQNATYTHTIIPDPNTVGTITGQSGTLSTPYIELTDGGYTVTALNEVSGCITTNTTTIVPAVYNMVITDTLVNHKLMCFLDGDITATQITINRNITSMANQVFNTPLNTDFEFRWFKNIPGTFTSGAPLADGSSATINTEGFVIGTGAGEFTDAAPTNGAGTYYIVGRQLSTTGRFGANCETVPLRVEILDRSEDPVAALTPTTDTSCDGPFEGSISVLVTDDSPLAGPFDYNYTWAALTAGRATPGPVTNPYNGNNNLFSLVEDGVYELSVFNNQTGCTSITAQTTISKTAVPIVIASASHLDQLICNPDGSITVIDITVNGVIDAAHNNFYFKWYRNAVTPGTELVPFNPPSGNDVLDVVDLPATMGAGTYFVSAQRVLGLPFGSGCESAPLRVEITDESEDPDFDFISIRADSSCNVMNPLGTILATAFERDATIDAYNFVWDYNTTGALDPLTTQDNSVPPTSRLTGAPAGPYQLTVLNTMTGCDFIRDIVLERDTTRSLPNIVNVLTVNPINCLPTGSAEVVEITVGGTTTYTNPPDDIDTDFDYIWREGSSPTIISTNHNIAGLLPATYFVHVTEVNTGCSSSMVEVLIDTAFIVRPDVKIRQTSPQIFCDETLGGSGILIATADLNSTEIPYDSRTNYPNYEMFWFRSGTPVNVASDSVITNQIAGNFTVEVFDITTGCTSIEPFIVANDSTEFKPILLLSSNPLTECDSIDGFVSARALFHERDIFNPSNNYPATFLPYNYGAEFYTGTPPDLDTPGPDLPTVMPTTTTVSQTFVQPNLVDGMYTVRLTDLNTGCQAVDTVSVKDKRIYIPPVITEIAPVTNCDELRPNGVAKALVNGGFLGYSFEWFEGTIPSGSPVFVGAEFGELKMLPTQYVVRATNLITGCSDSTVTSMTNATVAIQAPTITILSHVTSCDVNNPNGILTASVNGNTINHTFFWYDNRATTPPLPLPTPDYTGEIYDSLAAGLYGVMARSKITGCLSPLVSETLLFKPDYPEIDFEIKKALCGQNNGAVSLIITTDVAIDTVQWYFDFFDNNGNPTGLPVPGGEGPILSEVIAGDYSVLVTTILGCSSFANVTIDTEIRPYNGISRASTPGQNDYFHIDCIESFERNIVKIFNRAGTLVYEQEGYDNFDISKRFDGKSNKGLSVMGNNLPDGTYFYIVDKRNGSKPLAGYLEIVK